MFRLSNLPPDSRHNAAIAVIFLLVLLAGYALSAAAMSGPFLFDDFPNLQRLSAVSSHWDFAHISNYLSQFPGNPGRPLSALSFLINDDSWPSEPAPFKYTNLMLHLLAGVMVFGLVRTLAEAARLPGNANWIALATMAAWLLHPMQLSTSMLVVQRMTLLSALFSLAGLWTYSRLAFRAQTGLEAFWALVALGTATILAILCKENGALLPLLACVLNATLLSNRIQEKTAPVRRWLWLGCTVPVLVLAISLILQGSDLANYASRDFTLGERLLTQSRVLLDYVRIILIPTMNSGIYHDDFVASHGLLDPITTLASIIAIAVLGVFAIVFRRKAPVLSFAIAWFFAGHLLESTVFPLEIYFEHRNYLPMIGWLFLIAATVVSLAAKARPAFALAWSIWIAMSAFMLHQQALVWGNEALMATIWAKENSGSQRAIQQYSLYLQQHGRAEEAIRQMLAANDRGVGTAVFPFQALQVACVVNDNAFDSVDLYARTLEAAKQEKFDYGTALTLSRLRELARDRQCPALLDDSRWIQLSAYLLANPAYERSIGSYLVHLERSYYYRDQQDLNGTITELEAAYTLSPKIEITQLIALSLWTAGLNEQAISWLEKGLKLKQPLVRKILSNEVQESQTMLSILRRERTNDASQ